MTSFWNSWIAIISVLCWLFILFVLVFNLKFKPELKDDGTTGHEYDGVKEYDRPLPKWWLWIFWGTLVWAISYVWLFPGLMPKIWAGAATVEVDGKEVPWTSANEMKSEFQSNNRIFLDNFENSVLPASDATGAVPILSDLKSLGVEEQDLKKNGEEIPAELNEKVNAKLDELAPYVAKLAANPEAQMMGSRLFLQNCALCHGSTAQGSGNTGLGYPNLTDVDWLHGGEPQNILKTLYYGRHVTPAGQEPVLAMPAWRPTIGEDGVRAVAEYVLSISGNQNGDELDKLKVTQGQALFKAQCSVCHGEEGKGMHSTGAPNLTDDIWLFGNSREQIRETLRHGRNGVMPAWRFLGDQRVMLLASYVYSLSNGAEPMMDEDEVTANSPVKEESH